MECGGLTPLSESAPGPERLLVGKAASSRRTPNRAMRIRDSNPGACRSLTRLGTAMAHSFRTFRTHLGVAVSWRHGVIPLQAR